jgi:hypothetical protein
VRRGQRTAAECRRHRRLPSGHSHRHGLSVARTADIGARNDGA